MGIRILLLGENICADFRHWSGVWYHHEFPIWYYGPTEFANFFGEQWKLKSFQAIGGFLPPSACEGFFRKKKYLMRSLYFLEQGLGKWSAIYKRADHFLIHLIKTH